MEPIIIVAAVLFLLILLASSSIVIVPQASAFIVERLGAYQATWETGLHFKIPILERAVQTWPATRICPAAARLSMVSKTTAFIPMIRSALVFSLPITKCLRVIGRIITSRKRAAARKPPI